MIYGLAVSEFKKAHPLFASLENRVTIHALIEGSCPGRISVDDPTEPTTTFVGQGSARFAVKRSSAKETNCDS